MKAPLISLTCDCGAQASVGYGERWRCEACGRTYDASHIPEREYQALVAIQRRYRSVGWALMGVLAVLVLALALSGQPIQIMAGLPVILIAWFTYGRPLMRRRYRRRIRELTRSWELHAEPKG
jgi:hypothetical protein